MEPEAVRPLVVEALGALVEVLAPAGEVAPPDPRRRIRLRVVVVDLARDFQVEVEADPLRLTQVVAAVGEVLPIRARTRGGGLMVILMKILKRTRRRRTRILTPLTGPGRRQLRQRLHPLLRS